MNLGMPDEENMRHWSHHQSSDTVDDPVFRAAMRGYDAVSFVFGLEVTWSLIQQRRQEEDEKQALKELEAAQELGCVIEELDEGRCEKSNEEKASDDSCSATDGEDKNVVTEQSAKDPAVTIETETESAGEDDGVWNLSHIYSVEEIQSTTPLICTSDGCKNIACCLWNSDNGGEEKACLKCQHEEFGGWPDGLEPQDAVHKECITKICTQPPAQIMTETNQSAVEKHPQDEILPEDEGVSTLSEAECSQSEIMPTSPPSKTTKWTCEVCTFQNAIKAKKCKMCQTLRSPKKMRF